MESDVEKNFYLIHLPNEYLLFCFKMSEKNCNPKLEIFLLEVVKLYFIRITKEFFFKPLKSLTVRTLYFVYAL